MNTVGHKRGLLKKKNVKLLIILIEYTIANDANKTISLTFRG